MTLVRSSPSGQLIDVGSGGSSQPLSSLFFIDPNTTVPLASQNGSTGAPFQTITQGIDALLASPLRAGALVLCDGNYNAEDVVWAPPTVGFTLEECKLTLWGSPAVSNIGSLTVTGGIDPAVNVAIRNLGGYAYNTSNAPAIDTLTATGFTVLEALDSSIGTVTGFTQLHGSRLAVADVTGLAYCTGTDIRFDGVLNVSEGCELQQCYITSASVLTGQIYLTDCFFGGDVDASSAQFRNCRDVIFNTSLDVGTITLSYTELFNCTVGVEGGGTLTIADCALYDCIVSGFVDCDDAGVFYAQNSLFFNGIDAGQITLRDCQVEGSLFAFDSATLRQCVMQTFGFGSLEATFIILQDCEINTTVTAITRLDTDTKSWQFIRNSSNISAPLINLTDQPNTPGNTWDGSAPFVLQVLEDPHPVGLYAINVDITVFTAAAGNVASCLAEYTDIDGTPQQVSVLVFDGSTFSSSIPLDVVQPLPVASFTINSDGSAPINLTFTRDSGVGTPLAIIYATATPIGHF